MNVLADNNSYRKLGTAVHTITGALCGRLNGSIRVVNVVSNCENLVCNRAEGVGPRGFSNVLAVNNAVLNASERPFGLVHIISRGDISGIRTVGGGCGGLNLSYLIMLNNGKARGATGLLHRRKLGIISLPGAVSGSL